MATLEKSKQKKSKQRVPSKSSKLKPVQNVAIDKQTTSNSGTDDFVGNEQDEASSFQIEEGTTSASNIGEEFIDVSNGEISSQNERTNLEEEKEDNIEACTEETISKVEEESVKQFQIEETEVISQIDKINVTDNEMKDVCDVNRDKTISTVVSYPQVPVEESPPYTTTVIKKESIKPFTKSQLEALYTNQELTASKHFIKQFVDSELTGLNGKQHPLHDLLTKYLEAKNKLKENTLELNQLKTEYKTCQNQMWLIESATVSNRAQCQDSVYVTATHEYKTAKFQMNLLESLIKLQNKIKKLVNEVHTLHSYNTSILKLKIDNYIETVTTSCRNAANLSHNAPVILFSEEPNARIQFHLRELRICISVLFAFQRHLYKDREFVLETRVWLTTLVAVLLRLANWQDHLYILNQVLRCPAGVGSWASSYIQVPSPVCLLESPFANRYLNHTITVLNVLLCPVEKRDAFLEQILITLKDPHDSVEANRWILVDSDGEEDEDNSCGIFALKENDLVTLLNQIPIDDLFRNILLIQRRDNKDLYNKEAVTEHHILRLLAFSTVLVNLFNEGLITYNMARYHQFAKRLCRLIRHALQYVSDMWEIFRINNKVNDLAMLERLQTEFDAFFLRSTLCLYRAQQLGAWQFLAIAPFHTISIRTLWQFFYILHQGSFEEEELESFNDTDFRAKLSEPSSRQHFSDRLCIMSTDESYYLLNTFANMIMAREAQDEDFIKFATLNLLQIGFHNSESQENCCKCAGILLSNITERYPYLITDILLEIKISINDLRQLMFLFSELPLHIWRPTEKDFDILSIWFLQYPITSIESYLARKILSNLNWDFINGVLCLPLSQHRQVALLIAEVIDKRAAEAGFALVEGVKQVVVGQQMTPEQNFLKWAWQMVFRLRLHATDRGTVDVKTIPEVVEFHIIQKGMRDRQPLICYLSLAMTAVGHLLPLVCSQGLAQLEILLSYYKYDAVLLALHNIIPLFLDSAETLLMCTSFQTILINLLSADRTYMKMAKSLISSEFPGTILQQFSSMITNHIHNPKWQQLIVFWVEALLSVPNWNKDSNVLYLLNIIIRTAFFIPEIYQRVCDVFQQLLEKITDRNSNSNSSLFSWISLGSAQGVGSSLLLGPGSIVSKEPWLGYLIINLEHQHVEIRTKLWPELLRQLYTSIGKTNIDSSLKKAGNVLKVPSFSSSGLCLYRFAQQALDTPLDHPLLPLIWQKFFSLYLARVPSTPDEQNRGSVGSKFFDGLVNTSFCKKLKKRLQESVDFYKNKLDLATTLVDENSRNLPSATTNVDFDKRCMTIFKAYILWLEEPLLQEATLYLPSLPSEYEPQYLQLIIQNSTSPWVELINYDTIHNEYEKLKMEWESLCNRHKIATRYVPIQKISGGEIKDPVERILRRLSSYDKPLSAPDLKHTAPVVPVLNFPNKESIADVLQPHLKKLQQFTEIYSLQVSEHSALNGQYKDLIQQLYNNFQTKMTFKKCCKSICSGPAVITITFCEARQNENINHQMQTNRTNFATLLTQSLQPISQGLCINCVSFEQTITMLQGKWQENLRGNDLESATQVSGIAVEFFYYLLNAYNDEFRTYPPTQQLFYNCMQQLGQVFLYGIDKEIVRLCKTILQHPNKGNLLIPHFIAVNLSTNTFLQLYSEICDKIEQIPEITFGILSKFDVSDWLVNKRPRLSDRSKFIHLIFQSFNKLGPKPMKQMNSLHETYRRHLLCVFRHEFPEHYGEILMQILQNSGTQTISISVWMDILNALAYPSQLHFDIQLKEQLRNHATNQKMLQRKELMETASMLGKYFMQERLQFGIYGLYPKYRLYIDPICLFLGLTSYALVVATLQTNVDLLADQLCDQLWPYVLDVFSPWLIPYWTRQCKDDTATWIQQLTDDRAVVFPWIQADVTNAQKMFNMFVNCINFIGETLPACNNLLSYVWQFYTTNFAHPFVKEHIWIVVHASLLTITWEHFWPSLTDLEIMLKVIDQYLPECHTFLGHIFLEINWSNWLNRLMQQTNNEHAAVRAHHCLLHLLVKLANEPDIKQIDKARLLIDKAREYSWQVLDVNALEHILDWYVVSCDPRVVLNEDGVKIIDYSVLGLLRVVSCYDYTNQITNTFTMKKRQLFIRTYIKLLVNCSSRYKSLITNKPQQFQSALHNQLDHLETIIAKASENALVESDILLKELLTVLNQPTLLTIALECFNDWLNDKTTECNLISSFLRTTATVVTNPESVGTLLENALTSYFTATNPQTVTKLSWGQVMMLLEPGPPKQPTLEQTLITSGRLLTLYVIILKRTAICDEENVSSLLDMIVEWFTYIKATDTMEPKLPLLWNEVIKLSLRVCHQSNEEKAAVNLRKFVHNHLLPIAECKTGNTSWGRGLLGAIGLAKQNHVSPQCRFLCKALAGYILAQLPEPKGEPATVRCFAGASGPVGQPGGNLECAKVLLKMDVGVSELKQQIESALRQIQDPQNSLHNGESFLFGLVDTLYSKTYLKKH